MDTVCMCKEGTKYTIIEENTKIDVRGVMVEGITKKVTCDDCLKFKFVRDVEISNSFVLFNDYKRKTGLLTSDEITKIREFSGMNPKAFAKKIGVSETFVSRLESGSIQELDLDNKIRKVFKKEVEKIYE